MEYIKITQDVIDKLNKAVSEDSARDFFETLSFHVYDCGDGQLELSGVHTKGGVEMIITIEEHYWIESFLDYYEGFDPDEEVNLHRQSSDYCHDFSLRESIDDFEDWDNYINLLLQIAQADGEYKYTHTIRHASAKFVLMFPKNSKFRLEGLNGLDDSKLLDLHYFNSDVLKVGIDNFEDNVNMTDDYIKNYFIKFIR